MDISTQNYNVGERTFVDDTDYSNFNLTLTQLISTATTETTPQAIARLNRDIDALKSQIKPYSNNSGRSGQLSVMFINGRLKNKIADKQKQIDYIKANGTYCERRNNCPKNISNINIINPINSRGGSGAIDTPRGGSGAVVVPLPNIGGGRVMGTPQYDSPTTEQPQDTATDDSATDTQNPAPMGMSMNTKYLIGAIVLIGGFYLLKKKN